jgi:hypothetical protein
MANWPSFWHAKINEQYSWMNVISVMTSETIPNLSWVAFFCSHKSEYDSQTEKLLGDIWGVKFHHNKWLYNQSCRRIITTGHKSLATPTASRSRLMISSVVSFHRTPNIVFPFYCSYLDGWLWYRDDSWEMHVGAVVVVAVVAARISVLFCSIISFNIVFVGRTLVCWEKPRLNPSFAC